MDINILAVIVAAIASMALGFLWYSEAVFGSAWRLLTDLTAEDIGNKDTAGMMKNYILSTLGSFVMAIVLALAINYVEPGSILTGIEVGFWAWLGFVAPVQMTSVLFGKKPWKLYFLETGYFLVSLLVMGAIIGVWV